MNIRMCVWFALRSAGALALAGALAACGPSAEEYERVVAENAHLKEELARVHKPARTDTPDALSKPDLILAITELWSQRFEDSEFRARQRLSDKILRVTGVVEGVTPDSVIVCSTIKGTDKVRITVKLSNAYVAKVRDGLFSLEAGVPVTVQGQFAYDRMWLTDAVFVDKSSGKPLNSDDLMQLLQTAGLGLTTPEK